MRKARVGALVATTLFLAAAAIGYGCGGGDDTSGAGPQDGSEAGGPDGSSFDAAGKDSSVRDSGTSDAGTRDTGAAETGPVDAGPLAHVVFLTHMSFDGNLIGAAGDGGVLPDGGVSAVAAADSLCQSAADAAHIAGTFHAIIDSHTENGYSRFQNSDGPWALLDGTPLAETAADLVSGNWHTSIYDYDNGTTTGANFSAVWTDRGGLLPDCVGWSTNEADAGGYAGTVGTAGYISPDALGDTNRECDESASLICAQVGPGGAMNHYPAIPAGAKIAFVTAGTNNGGFATIDAGADSGAPAGADGAHKSADLACNLEAHAAGLTGNFHAFISTSSADAVTYFTSLSMNGPWYRPDGFEVASSRADLVSTTSLHTQLSLSADGTFAATLQNFTWTGSSGGGAIASDTCNDFVDPTSGHKGSVASDEIAGAFGLEDFGAIGCNFPAKFYCFEQ